MEVSTNVLLEEKPNVSGLQSLGVFIKENKFVLSTLFVSIMLLLVLITPYYVTTDLGDYSDVAKYFAGKL